MRILALDLARLSGWAVGSPDGELPKTDKWNLGEYGMAARVFCRRILAHTVPDWVVYEAPILRSGKIKTRGNGKQFVATVDTPEKLRKIYGLPWELEIECLRAGIPVREANIGSVRSAFLMAKVPTNSEACKTAVKVMARRRGWNVLDDNEADALAVLDFELAMKCPTRMAVRRINAGPSVALSSSGPAVFVGSRVFFPPATKTAAPDTSKNGGAGASNASSTAPASPSETMEISPPSTALPITTSTSSARRPTPTFAR
jgi:hypothetical protein